MRRLPIILLLLTCLPVFGQRFVRTVNTIPDLVAANVNDVHTNIFVADTNRGGIFFLVPNQTATNVGTKFASSTAGYSWRRQYSGQINAKWFDAKGDGITDDTAAITNAIYAANSGDTIYFPYGTFIISQEILVSKSIRFKGDESNLKFSATFDDQGTATLGMFQVATTNVTFDTLSFDGTGASNEALNNRFLWITSGRCSIRHCSFKSQPAGGSNFNGAIGFGITSWEGAVEDCRFDDCSSSVFTQGPRTRIADCISMSPKDVSYALNSTNANACSVIGCKVYNGSRSVAMHIGAEEGPSNFIITDNYVYGVKDGRGIGAIHVSVLNCGTNGLIANNIVDGGSMTSVNPSTLLDVDQLYYDITISGNTFINPPAGSGNNVPIKLCLARTVFSNNRLTGVPGSSGYGSISLFGGDSWLRLDNNDIAGLNRCLTFYPTITYTNGVIYSKGNMFRDASIAVDLTYARDAAFHTVDDTFVNCAAEVLRGGGGWWILFSTYDAYKYPYKITDHIEIYSPSMPDPTNSVGTWNTGDKLWRRDVRNWGIQTNLGWVCTTNGTFGRPTNSGSIGINDSNLVVTNIDEYYVGDYITIAGVSGVKKIVSIYGTNYYGYGTFVVDSNSDATVSGAEVIGAVPGFTMLPILP